jgi:dihydroceramidase
VYHQVVFATMVLFMAIRIQHLLKTRAENIPTSLKNDIPFFFWTGSGLFILAFIIWSLDNIFCDTLTAWRVFVGWPAAFLLEGKLIRHFHEPIDVYILSIGHSWWHVLTVNVIWTTG